MVRLKNNVRPKRGMSRISIATFAALLIATATTVLFQTQDASAERKEVEYTFTIADLGQGIWGGGPLYSDGSASGNVAFSAGNGEIVFQIQPVSWEEVNGGEAVDICFETREIKGDAFFPPEFCLSDIGSVLPVTGEPVIEDRFLFRVTAVGN